MEERHELYSLQTRTVITRRRVTELPATQAIIDKVNSFACSDGIKSLRISSFSSLAGVGSTITGVADDPPTNENENEDDYPDDVGYEEEDDETEAEESPNSLPVEDDDPYQGEQSAPPSTEPIEDNSTSQASVNEEEADEPSVEDEVPHHHQPELRRAHLP